MDTQRHTQAHTDIQTDTYRGTHTHTHTDITYPAATAHIHIKNMEKKIILVTWPEPSSGRHLSPVS